MKFFLHYTAAIAALCIAALSCPAQTTPPAQPTPPHQGKVIFSRSSAEGALAPPQVPAAGELAPPQVAAPQLDTAPKAQSPAPQVPFTAFDLDVHLLPAEQHIAVRALLTVRNDGKTPLARIPLQISSSLNWERIRIEERDIPLHVATVNSDADHTGQLHEAVVPLDAPLLPGQSLSLDVTYSGTIALTARRLQSIGAPDSLALHSDWDQISLPFTGLRGFGNVLWYPAVSAPVLLGDGARLFDEIGEHKLRLSGARFRLRLTVEFPHGQAPTVALINGHAVPLTITEPEKTLDQNQEVSSVATADSGISILGFEAPSLFVATRSPHAGPNLTAWTLPENNVSVIFWTTSATAVTPFLEGWLGKQPRSQLTLLDLPDPDDAPFETGALLAVPLREPGSRATSGTLNGVLVHALTHAWITSPALPNVPAPTNPPQPPPAWLNEGVAQFISTLWVEKQYGRDTALRLLESDRPALALVEPASPGQSPGQPLATAISPVYYRTKAAYVLWMLRDLAGDPALTAALRAYPAIPGTFEKLLEASEAHPNLAWFFADWVDADKGLPDLTIEGVFPTSTSAGNWLVAVNLANAGYAAADVPVTVRSGIGSDARSVTQRLRVPARGKASVRILIQGKPTEVQVNDGAVPETQARVHITKLTDPASASPNQSQSNPPKQ
jgi:hypothetical protein